MKSVRYQARADRSNILRALGLNSTWNCGDSLIIGDCQVEIYERKCVDREEMRAIWDTRRQVSEFFVDVEVECASHVVDARLREWLRAR